MDSQHWVKCVVMAARGTRKWEKRIKIHKLKSMAGGDAISSGLTRDSMTNIIAHCTGAGSVNQQVKRLDPDGQYAELSGVVYLVQEDASHAYQSYTLQEYEQDFE